MGPKALCFHHQKGFKQELLPEYLYVLSNNIISFIRSSWSHWTSVHEHFLHKFNEDFRGPAGAIFFSNKATWWWGYIGASKSLQTLPCKVTGPCSWVPRLIGWAGCMEGWMADTWMAGEWPCKPIKLIPTWLMLVTQSSGSLDNSYSHGSAPFTTEEWRTEEARQRQTGMWLGSWDRAMALSISKTLKTIFHFSHTTNQPPMKEKEQIKMIGVNISARSIVGCVAEKIFSKEDLELRRSFCSSEPFLPCRPFRSLPTISSKAARIIET